jgi:hypothetical protein
MASSSTWSLNGFSMKSTAPSFMACTAIDTSPWPVMKMMGRRRPRAFMACCSSSPLIVGMRTSSTRQPTAVAPAWARKLSASAKPSARQPTDSARNTTERRMALSSSTT